MKTKKNKMYKKTKKSKKSKKTSKHKKTYKKFNKKGGYIEINDRLRLQENAPIPVLNIYYFILDDSVEEGLKLAFIVQLKNVVASLDEINGFNLEGIITNIKSINGFSLESLEPNLKTDINFNIYDIQFLRDNHLGIQYDMSDSAKILYQYKLLLENTYPNITWRREISQDALYFFCPPAPTSQSSQYYKIHISVNAKDLEITIEKLMSILCEYKSLFSQGKIPLPKTTPFYDVRDEYAKKYLKWNCGSTAANIVLYVNPEYDSKPREFERLLNNFIFDWIEIGADEYGRELNNLYFNQRISKSLYIGYGSDSNSKCRELENLLKDNTIPRRFKMSQNLKTEQAKLCKPNYKELASYDMLNSCLLDTYNISYSDLCDKDNYSAKDVWVREEMPQENEIPIGSECYYRKI